MNQLLLGDNLEILRTMPDESIDLIYLDPPFFSNRTYEVIWGDKGEVRSFEDRFSGGIDHYIAWLKDRITEMHRLLKPTGSIFLHCDWHADAYIRVLILDKIFGMNNFRNHITWKRAETVKGNFGQGKKSLDYNTDSIFFYSKSNQLTFIQPFNKYSDEYLKQFYKYEESDGRKYRLISMIGPGGASKGNPQYEFLGVTKYWRYSEKKMHEMYKERLIIQTKVGNVPQKKQYLDTGKGVAIQSLWDDIFALSASNKETIGYPTQKPLALLQRIIEMASNEGDTVLDPFVGGGTTVAVADRLGRNWIGIDQSVSAVKVTEMRLNAQQDLFSKPFTLRLHKYDYDTVRNSDAFAFESFIITQYGGQAQNKKGGDKGIDGKTKDGAPIQVKRSDDIGVNVVKNFFVSAMQYDKTRYEHNKSAGLAVGYIIAFSFGKGAIQEAARLRNEEGAIIQLVRVDEIIPIAKKPKLTVTVNDLGKNTKGLQEIQFVATAESDAGISFYNWDFNYNEKEKTFKPTILLDSTGTQTQTFKAGQHTIMIKVIDNEGLEGTELIQLKINGKMHRIV